MTGLPASRLNIACLAGSHRGCRPCSTCTFPSVIYCSSRALECDTRLVIQCKPSAASVPAGLVHHHQTGATSTLLVHHKRRERSRMCRRCGHGRAVAAGGASAAACDRICGTGCCKPCAAPTQCSLQWLCRTHSGNCSNTVQPWWNVKAACGLQSRSAAYQLLCISNLNTMALTQRRRQRCVTVSRSLCAETPTCTSVCSNISTTQPKLCEAQGRLPIPRSA